MRIRRLRPDDSFEDLTALLHRAYARLAKMGLRFVATYQDVETTRRRAMSGECFVVEEGAAIVATGTLYGPNPESGCELYRQPDLWHFGQFAVEPGLQGRGVGYSLLQRLEERARELGARRLALDTSESALHLIDYYRRQGFQVVGRVNWEETNYVSVLMVKELSSSPIPPEAR